MVRASGRRAQAHAIREFREQQGLNVGALATVPLKGLTEGMPAPRERRPARHHSKGGRR